MNSWRHLGTVAEKAVHPHYECNRCGEYIDQGDGLVVDTWRHPAGKDKYIVTTCMPCADGTTAEQRMPEAMKAAT
jgi:hypothetical protein